MVRETRYLWVGNLPDKITEERIYEHFQRYGKIQSVRLHKKEGESGSATIAFMDIKSASKAHNADNTIENIKVLTQYSDSTATGTSVTRTDPLEATRGLYNTAQIRQGRFPASSRPEGLTEERAYPRQEYYSGREQTYDRRQQGYEEFNRTQTKQKFDATAKPQRFREHSQTRNVTTPRAYETHQAEPRERIDWARAPPSPARSTSSQWSRKRSPSPTPRSRSSSVSSNGSTGSSRSRSRSIKSVRDRDERKTSITLESARLSSQTSVDSLDKGDDKKNLGICVRGMPVRSSDTSLRDGLFHEYKKHGKVTSVHVFGQGEERYAIVSFKKPEDASKALEASQGKMFFGTKIEVAEHEGFEAEDEFRPPEAELDEYHPKATRTLFVGNLEKDISKDELREIFRGYGEIIDIDIKKQGAVSAYGFVQYSDICSVVKALRKMDGEHIGANKIKLGFGKSMPTNCVWLDNVAETVTERFLMRQFSRYGGASHSVIDRSLGRALIYYDNMEYAQYAVSEMRGRALGGKKLQIDFASRECQNRFFERMERTGQLRPGERPDERAGGRWSRTSGEFFDENSSSSSRDFNSFPTGGRGRQGFTQFERGRGPFQRGSNRRNFRGRGQGRGRGFYEGFSDDYRQRSLDDFPADENLAEDSYEQELREYYQQRERIDQRSPDESERSQDRLGSPFSHKRSDSPEFERPRDMEEYYSEKFKDTDSQSGDRESVRSYRSSRSDSRRDTTEKHYEEKYGREHYFEDYTHDKRAQSPTTSDYSQQSRSPRHRSRSVTPIPKDHRGRGSRTQSPDAFMDFPRQESPTPMDYDSLHEYTKGREKKQEKRHSQEESESLTGARIKSKRSSRASDMDSDTEKVRKSQKPRAYMSDDEASDPEPMLKSEVSDRFVKRHSTDTLPKPKVISTEEYFKRKMDKFPRSSVTSTVTKVKRKETSVDVRTDVKESRVEKLERTYRPEKTVEKHESNVPKSYVKKVTKVLPGPLEGQQPGVTTQSPGSSSSSGSCKLDSDQDSVADRESVRSQASLEKKRQQLLDQLQELEDSGSMSDNDSGSIDDERKRKPRLEDVFDLEHFEHDKRKDMSKTDAENPSVSEKLKDSGVTDPKASGVTRFKPIDSTQSYRKQMEAHRKMEEKRTKGEIKPGKSERSKLVHQSNYLDEEDPLGSDQDNKSPKEIPAEFISRKRKKSDAAEEPFPKARRKYRMKNTSEEIFSPSSGEDSDHEPKGAKTKLSVSVAPKPIGMVEPMTVSMVTPQKVDGGQVMVTPIGKHSFPEIVKPGMPGPSPVGPPSPKPVPPPDYTMDKLDSMADSDKTVSRYNVIGDTRHVLVNSDHTLETPKRTVGRPPLDSRLGSVVLKPDKQSDIDSPTERTKSVPETKQDIWKPRETSHSPVEKFSVPEPRTIPTDTKREGPMSLPLPRFARQSSFGVSPKVSPKASPKHQPSPKVSSPQVSCSISKLQSPPFSPGQSSHSSPVWTKPDPPPPPPPPLESKDPAEPVAPDLLEEQPEITPVSVQEPAQPPTLVSTTDTAEKEEPAPKESTASLQKAATTDAIDTEKKPAVKEEESDSELSSPLHSPTSVSLDERIRALDEKLSLTSALKTERPPPPPPSFDYRDKYRVVKKRTAPAVNMTSSSSSTTNPGMESRAEPSDIVHKILSRSSIFDQDFKRLEKIDEKYEPKGINLERSRSPGRSGPVRTKGCPKEIPNMSQIEPLDSAQHRQIPASAPPYSTRPDPLVTSHSGRPPLLTSTSFTQQSTSMRTPGTTSLGKSASFDFVRSSSSSSPRQSSTQHNKEGWPPLVLDDSSGPKWIEPAGANTPRVSQGMSPRSTASMSPASDHMPVLSAIKRDPVPEYNSSKDVTSVISSKQESGRSGNGKKTSSPEDVKPAVTDVKTTPLLKKTSSESGKSEGQKSSEPENKRVKLSSGNVSKEKSLDGSRSSHKESKKSKQSSVAKSPDKRLFVPDTPKSTDKKREDKQPEQKAIEKQISVEKVNETTAEKKKESSQEKTKESHQEKNKESHPEKLKESVKEKDTSSEKDKSKEKDSGKTTVEKDRTKERDSSKSNVDKEKQKESSKNKDHKEKRDGKEHGKSKHHKDKKERVKSEAESCSSDKKSDDGRPEKRDDKDRQRHKHPEHKHNDMKKHSQKEKPSDTSTETSKSKSKEENHESKSKSKEESSDNKTKCKETVSSESKTKVKEDNKSAHKEKSKDKNEKSDKNHKQVSSSSSTSSDKHKPPERGDSKDKGDSRDKGSRESTSSKKAPKQDKHREHKDEGSKSSSKQQSKESKDKDNKEKTQSSSEKHRQKVTDKQDKKSDKREKKPPKPKEPEFNALNLEEDPFAPYLSMYDKIKRRSNKEQPKEEKTEKVKETLAQLQEMRKKKIGCSDDSNGMCPEDDEPIVKEIKPEPKKHPKKESEKSKELKTKRRWIIDSSSSDEDSSKSDNSEAFNELTRRPAKAKKDWSKIWSCSSSTSSEEEHSTPKSKKKSKSYSIESSDSEPLPPVKKQEPKLKKVKEKLKEKKPEKKKPETKEDGKFSSESSKFVKKSFSESSVKQVKSSQKEKISKKTKDVSKDREKINDSPKETPQKTSKDPLSKQLSSQKQQQEKKSRN